MGVIPFEDDAVLYCAKGWRNRHGRFYDIPHLIKRVADNLNNMSLIIYTVKNEKKIDPSCYIRFAALLEKRL